MISLWGGSKLHLKCCSRWLLKCSIGSKLGCKVDGQRDPKTIGVSTPLSWKHLSSGFVQGAVAVLHTIFHLYFCLSHVFVKQVRTVSSLRKLGWSYFAGTKPTCLVVACLLKPYITAQIQEPFSESGLSLCLDILHVPLSLLDSSILNAYYAMKPRCISWAVTSLLKPPSFLISPPWKQNKCYGNTLN